MKRVMILSRQSAFWWGVCKLLGDGGTCDLVGWETEPEQAIRRVRDLQPDVVLVDRCSSITADTFPIVPILGVRPGTRVIALGVEDNILSLYREDRHTVADVEDLIRVIEQDVAADPGEHHGRVER